MQLLSIAVVSYLSSRIFNVENDFGTVTVYNPTLLKAGMIQIGYFIFAILKDTALLLY